MQKQSLFKAKEIGRNFFLIFILATSFLACEKEITVDLPQAEPKIVVEGSIEQGNPPFVLLSKSQGYFDPIDINSLQNLYLQGATVIVSNGTITDTLQQICSSQIPEDLLPLVTEITGFTAEQLQTIDICAYLSFNEAIWGELGKIYDLRVEYEGEVVTSSTKINELVQLDSTWFQISGNTDSLGFAYAILEDPDSLGNAYRWFAKRINSYPDWSEHAGEQKDQSFIAPIGSVYDDMFFNGLSFEFAYYRGAQPNSNKEDDNNDERGYFKVGDTIVVRGCVIDRGVYEFVTSMETQVSSNGSPFASPGNVRSNVVGGLGVWAGYGAVYDTIICLPE